MVSTPVQYLYSNTSTLTVKYTVQRMCAYLVFLSKLRGLVAGLEHLKNIISLMQSLSFYKISSFLILL